MLSKHHQTVFTLGAYLWPGSAVSHEQLCVEHVAQADIGLTEHCGCMWKPDHVFTALLMCSVHETLTVKYTGWMHEPRRFYPENRVTTMTLQQQKSCAAAWFTVWFPFLTQISRRLKLKKVLKPLQFPWNSDDWCCFFHAAVFCRVNLSFYQVWVKKPPQRLLY